MDLRKWAADNNCTQSSIKGVLSIINKYYGENLYIDARTLMRTPTNVNCVRIGLNGFYWHQRLDFCLKHCFAALNKPLDISIYVNMDGLPIFNSSTKCWPILFNVFEYVEI